MNFKKISREIKQDYADGIYSSSFYDYNTDYDVVIRISGHLPDASHIINHAYDNDEFSPDGSFNMILFFTNDIDDEELDEILDEIEQDFNKDDVICNLYWDYL